MDARCEQGKPGYLFLFQVFLNDNYEGGGFGGNLGGFGLFGLGMDGVSVLVLMRQMRRALAYRRVVVPAIKLVL